MARKSKKQFFLFRLLPDLKRLKSRFKRRFVSKRVLKWTAFGFAAAVLLLAAYTVYISIRIEKRFSGRRWSVPSKVFSNTTVLYPGQRIAQPLLLEKLNRLGYRAVSSRPSRKGRMRSMDSAIEIYLHDLELPHHKREGFRARIDFWGGEIDSIVNMGSEEAMPVLELEPEEIATLFGSERERRRLISIEQVPDHLIHALLSAEDKRFYEHHGIDPKGMARALLANITRGSLVQGGSTITQQLAKCYFLYPKRSLPRKLREMLMALIIELKYEKDEILEIYLNEIYFGQKGSVSINGAGEASYFYFGKEVSELTVAEAATLAGLIKAPNHYSPYIDKEKCRERRNRVLEAMQENGYLTKDELKSALAASVSTSGSIDFRKQAPYFIDYLKEQLASFYSAHDLTSLGLSIYTTLDPQVQAAAEKALERGLARLERDNPKLYRKDAAKKIQGAVIVMQPKTGYILAMVGGRDYNVSQFNRATQARRQPGSAFKPFVFLAGLDTFTPVSRLSNKPVSYKVNDKFWEPQNFEPMEEEYLTMRDALARSVNRATVDLAMQVGMNHVLSTANSFKFSTKFQAVPSLSLGAFEVIPLDLARAYCAFAADGVLSYPLSLKDVVGDRGEALERKHAAIANVVSPAKAFMVTSMLRSAVTDGTGRPLASMGISFPVAGKTGTTNESRDAWFVGYTPRILALVWVGFDDQSSIHATGSTAAMPIWADLMNSIPQYISGENFDMPPGVVERRVCLDSGALANWTCPNSKDEIFLEENAPKGYCPTHGEADLFRRIWKNGKVFFNNL